MLRNLQINNIVLIEKLTIELGEGLCVLTGETGAGKSILLEAKVITKSSPLGFVAPNDAEGKVRVSPTSYPEPAVVTSIEVNDCESEVIIVNTAPVPSPLEV